MSGDRNTVRFGNGGAIMCEGLLARGYDAVGQP
jgi:hypothetical protein